MSAVSCIEIFGPHAGPWLACPAAPWWHLTPARAGWWLLAFVLASAVVVRLSELLADRWEITPCAPWRHRIARRWYGTHAHVTLRAEAEADDPERYAVLDWDDASASVPSLKVHKLSPESLNYWDEDSEAFWAPVTCFAPYAVRRLRPHFERFGRAWIPWLTLYLPLPGLEVPDGRTPAEVNTGYYVRTAAWDRPWDPPGTRAAMIAGGDGR